MERISNAALAVEALLLAPVTISALFVIPLAIRSASDEPGFAAFSLVTLVGLVSGWRLAAAFLFGGRLVARKVSPVWWVVATLSAATSISLWTLAVARPYPILYGVSLVQLGSLRDLGLIGFGIIFVPSYLHLSAEVWLRRV
jgi:hypothetical protein